MAISISPRHPAHSAPNSTRKSLQKLEMLTSSDFARHQKKALTFMLQREQAWSYDESQDNLWIQEVDEKRELTLVYIQIVKDPS